MARAASCKDLEWFDEATAQWAMDHLVPTIAQGLPGEFGMEPGLGRRRLQLRQERNAARGVSLRGAPDVDRKARPGHRSEAERLLRLPVLPVPRPHQGARHDQADLRRPGRRPEQRRGDRRRRRHEVGLAGVRQDPVDRLGRQGARLLGQRRRIPVRPGAGLRPGPDRSEDPSGAEGQAEDDPGRPEGAEERAVRAPRQRPRLQRQLRDRAAQHPLRAPEVQRPHGPRRRLLQPDRRPAGQRRR